MPESDDQTWHEILEPWSFGTSSKISGKWKNCRPKGRKISERFPENKSPHWCSGSIQLFNPSTLDCVSSSIRCCQVQKICPEGIHVKEFSQEMRPFNLIVLRLVECQAGYSGNPETDGGSCTICTDGNYAEEGSATCTSCGDNSNTGGSEGSVDSSACRENYTLPSLVNSTANQCANSFAQKRRPNDIAFALCEI